MTRVGFLSPADLIKVSCDRGTVFPVRHRVSRCTSGGTLRELGVRRGRTAAPNRRANCRANRRANCRANRRANCRANRRANRRILAASDGVEISGRHEARGHYSSLFSGRRRRLLSGTSTVLADDARATAAGGGRPRRRMRFATADLGQITRATRHGEGDANARKNAIKSVLDLGPGRNIGDRKRARGNSRKSPSATAASKSQNAAMFAAVESSEKGLEEGTRRLRLQARRARRSRNERSRRENGDHDHHARIVRLRASGRLHRFACSCPSRRITAEHCKRGDHAARS